MQCDFLVHGEGLHTASNNFLSLESLELLESLFPLMVGIKKVVYFLFPSLQEGTASAGQEASASGQEEQKVTLESQIIKN